MDIFNDCVNKDLYNLIYISNVKRIVKAKQIFLINTVGLCFLVNSMVMGFAAPAIPLLRDDNNINISEEEISWIASIVPLGAIFGAIMASYLLDWIGRRNLLFFSMMVFMASWVQIGMSSSVTILISARFFSGVCVGLAASAGNVYLSEMVLPNFRASQGVIIGVYGTFGIFLMAILVTFGSWRGLAWVGAVMCVPPLLCMLYLPESPYYLYYDSPMKSMESFEWLLEEEQEIRAKFKDMKSALKMCEKESNNGSLFSKTNAYPSFILVCLHVFQQLSGINVFIFYSTTIFSQIDGEGNAEMYSILMTVLNVICNFVSPIYQGYTQRRRLLKMSTMIMVPCLCIVATFFALKGSPSLSINNSGNKMTLIPISAIYLYIVSFALGWGPVPFLFMGEGLPSAIRGNATGKAMALNWASAFVITKSYSTLSTIIGQGWVFFIYGLCTLCGGLLMNFHLPETVGKTLNEMDIYYSKIKTN